MRVAAIQFTVTRHVAVPIERGDRPANVARIQTGHGRDMAGGVETKTARAEFETWRLLSPSRRVCCKVEHVDG